MDKLISQQAAIDVVAKWIFEVFGIKESDGTATVFKRLRELPSAEPEPRTAYWTKDIVGSVVCSNCGGIRKDNRIGHTQWCNCCGCFMRGE